MKSLLRIAALGAVASLAIACGGPAKEVEAPVVRGDGNADLARAFELEARGDQTKAIHAYVAVVMASVDAPDAFAIARVASALDAIVDHSPYPAMHSSLADRTGADVRGDLERAYGRAKGPFSKGLVARALGRLDGEAGDPLGAEKWRARGGCAREAAMYGPVSWSNVLAVSEKDPVADPAAALPDSIATDVAIASVAKRVDYTDRGCFLDTSAVSDEGGVREIVVDVIVPKAGKIGLSLRSHSSAILRAQGRPVLSRGYDEGGELVTKYATLDATVGTMRLAVRTGHETRGQGIELYAFDEGGAPLAMHAPQKGATADARVSHEAEVVLPAPRSQADVIAAAMFGLASQRGRLVERMLSGVKDKDAATGLLASRALAFATDLPAVERAERDRSQIERVLEAWPDAWEAVIRHATLAASRKGAGESKLEALADLDKHFAAVNDADKPLVSLFEAGIAGEARLWDKADAALLLGKNLDKTALYFDVARAAKSRTPREDLALVCGTRPVQSDYTCYFALTENAEWDRARAELARLRALYGSPKGLLGAESSIAITRADHDAAARILKDALPGERSIALVSLASGDASSVPSVARTAVDSPRALLPTESWAKKSPLAPFDGRTEALAAATRTQKESDAATSILDHEERYDLDRDGLLHYVMYDVRRVGGSADVESNSQAGAPTMYGRDASRILRRRIIKKDGRVLTPEQTPHAQQQGAELTQLEAGDVVEAIYEGIAMSGEMGELGFDSPDLLPARTSVKKATVAFTLPRALESLISSHAFLGKATRAENGDRVTLTWKLENAPVRRTEDGVPRMDRGVEVVFSTLTWKSVARALAETYSALEGDSTELDAIATSLKSLKTDKEKMDRAVVLSGERLKVGVPGVLSDYQAQRPASPQTIQLRTFLATHEGSRAFMVKKILDAVSIPSELIVAENEPFSTNPNFVAHTGRFTHPLLVAHPQSGDKREDVWLDLDVPGPPLPAGHVSPELRGKSALYADGSIHPLPANIGESERDEVDLRLVVDKAGDAKGDFTILLRGRSAQELAEAFEKVVGDERDKVLRNVVIAWVPYASVDSVSLSSSEGSAQVAVRASLTVPAYAQVEGARAAASKDPDKGDKTWVFPGMDPIHFVYPRPYTTTLSAMYAAQAGRSSAFAIGRATLVHIHRRVELPEGAEVSRLPGPFDAKRASFASSRTIAVQKNALEEEFTLSVLSGTVPASDYADFSRALHKTDDAFLTSIRVKAPK